MRTTKRLTRTVGVAAGLIGAVTAAAPDSRLGRASRRIGSRLARDLRYLAASTPGIVYRLSGRAPDPDVSDDILVDRIRSTIGPLEHRLDIPRPLVMVEDHVAILHGEIPDEKSAHALEHAVLHVSGVRGVESHLHPGLVGGDTRPSEGRLDRPRSEALQALVAAARDAGARRPESAVHSVLCAFVDRIPEAERAQLIGHLPADARRFAGPPRHVGESSPRPRTLSQLLARVTAMGGVEPEHAEVITRAVIATLRGIVPEEDRDITAVLPDELKALWTNDGHRLHIT